MSLYRCSFFYTAVRSIKFDCQFLNLTLLPNLFIYTSEFDWWNDKNNSVQKAWLKWKINWFWKNSLFFFEKRTLGDSYNIFINPIQYRLYLIGLTCLRLRKLFSTIWFPFRTTYWRTRPEILLGLVKSAVDQIKPKLIAIMDGRSFWSIWCIHFSQKYLMVEESIWCAFLFVLNEKKFSRKL